jgi:rubrerythrin
MAENERSLHMLKIALEIEEEGMSFYEEAIFKTKNPLALEIFGGLKADEDVHIERIKSIYTALEGEGSWSDDWTKLESNHDGLIPLFHELTRKHGKGITADTDDIEALDIGIELEEKSVKVYEDYLVQATDPHEKLFTERMLYEEKNHHAILMDMKSYLTNPDGWFADKKIEGLKRL